MSITKICQIIEGFMCEYMYEILEHCYQAKCGPGQVVTTFGSFKVGADTKYGIKLSYRWPSTCEVYIWNMLDKSHVNVHGLRSRKFLKFEWYTGSPKGMYVSTESAVINPRKAILSERERFNTFMNWNAFDDRVMHINLTKKLLKRCPQLLKQKEVA